MFLNILLTTGLITTLLFTKRVLTYIYIYTRSSSLPRYHHPDAWALVTGATNGIGRALASELALRGFNVILHGRNPSKLTVQTQELCSTVPFLKFHSVISDATLTGSDSQRSITSLVQELRDLKLNILINNIGGVPSSMVPPYKAFSTTTAQDNDDCLASNVAFPTQLTAALLPALLENQPSLILTLGSMGDVGSPWLSMYSGCKALLMVWSRSLRREMRAEGREVEGLGIMTGEVTGCSRNNRPATLIMPDAKTYAKAVLDRVSCGQAVVHGHWSQGILKGIVDRLPDFVLTLMLFDAVEVLKREYEMQR